MIQWPIAVVLAGILVALLGVVAALAWSSRTIGAMLRRPMAEALGQLADEIGEVAPDPRHNQTQTLTGT
jgi:hypothetical protein